MDAWNSRDADTFAGSFAPGALYITGGGERVRGRAAIAELVRRAAAGSTVTLVDTPEFDSRTGAVTFAWKAGRPARRGRIACVPIRRGDRWLIERLENTEDTDT